MLTLHRSSLLLLGLFDHLCQSLPLPAFIIHLLSLHLLQSRLPLQCFWTIVDPCDEPTLFILVYDYDSFSTEILDEFGQGYPFGGIHVQMVSLLNVFLIDLVSLDATGTESGQAEGQMGQTKLIVCVHVSPCDDTHLLFSNETNSS